VRQQTSHNNRNRTLLIVGGVIAVLLSCGVALSNYSVELGLSHASCGAIRAAAITAEVESDLEAEEGFFTFSETLRTALVATRKLAVNNPADGRVQAELGKALDCYSALRQSWQTELEGAWDPAVHGDPAYWRLFHRAVELDSAGPLDPAEMRELLRGEARTHVEEALRVVER
jgi:hypothetical protein